MRWLDDFQNNTSNTYLIFKINKHIRPPQYRITITYYMKKTIITNTISEMKCLKHHEIESILEIFFLVLCCVVYTICK